MNEEKMKSTSALKIFVLYLTLKRKENKTKNYIG